MQTLWKANEIYITENGCAGEDLLAEDGQVYDTERIMFARAYLTQLRRATAEGVPVKGYFYWSAMDNFEWTAGYGNRYGLVYVDFKTQKRTPKMSAPFFRETARRNEIAGCRIRSRDAALISPEIPATPPGSENSPQPDDNVSD